MARHGGSAINKAIGTPHQNSQTEDNGKNGNQHDDFPSSFNIEQII